MMKHLSILILLTFSNQLAAQWAWEDISPLYDQDRPFHIGCHVPNDSTAWAVPFWLDLSINPKFAVSDDYGQSWTVDTIELGDPGLMPVLVFSLNADTAWVITQQNPTGTYGTVHVTYNRGADWSLVDIPYNGNEVPLAVHFYNALEGVVVAQNFYTTTDYQHIYRTTDGGNTWADVSTPLEPGEVLWVYNGESIMERVGDKLFVGTGFGRVLRSEDRGASWEVIGLGLGARRGMNSVAFQDENTGIILSTYHLDSLNNPATRNGVSVAAKTTDGGDTWAPIDVPPLMEHIEYVPNSGGVYVGGMGYSGFAQYYISYDGGQQWQEKGSPGMINIVFSNTGVGYATTFGIENGIIRYAGPDLIFNDAPLPPSSWKGQGAGILPVRNSGAVYVHDICILDEESVWAIGTPGRQIGLSPHILKTTDGGANWEVLPISFSVNFFAHDIHAFDSQNALVSTNNGAGIHRIMRTGDGGASWTIQHTSEAAGGYLHFFNEQEGLIINNGHVEVTQDGGETWQDPVGPPGPNQDFVNFNGVTRHYDESKGDHFWYISSSNQRLLRSRDKGQNWEVFQTPASFNSIAMRDSLNGLAVEIGTFDTRLYFDSTTVFRTRDGGETWEIQATLADSFTIAQIEYVEGSENSYVGTSYYNASTSYTNDGGLSWAFIGENFFPDIVRFYDNQTGWAAKTFVYEGYSPVIYKWDGAPFPELIVGAEEIQAPAISLEVYPVPCRDQLNIRLPNGYTETLERLELLDASGKSIRALPGGNRRQWQVDVRDLPGGNYFLLIQTNAERHLQPFTKH